MIHYPRTALADELVTDLTGDALRSVWAPKVLGGLALHEATAGLDLDLWCVFSSAAALLGSPGQAAYATANAWLDALVALRRFRAALSGWDRTDIFAVATAAVREASDGGVRFKEITEAFINTSICVASRVCPLKSLSP